MNPNTPANAEVFGSWYSVAGGVICGGGFGAGVRVRQGDVKGILRSGGWRWRAWSTEQSSFLLVRCKDWAGDNGPCQSQRGAKGSWKGCEPRPPSEAFSVPCGGRQSKKALPCNSCVLT